MEIKQLSDIEPERANIEYIELTNLCHRSAWNASNEIFIKKHLQNPFGQSYGCWIYENDKLVALNLFMRWEFLFNGRIIKAAQSVDSLVHPDYQGRGLFRKVQDGCMEMIPSDVLRYGFPNFRSKPRLLKFGWHLSDQYVTKIYPVSWVKFIYTRCLKKQKKFTARLEPVNNDFHHNKKIIIDFLGEINKHNTTNFSYNLLSWKILMNNALKIRLFKNDSGIVGLVIYSIQYIKNYVLFSITDFLRLEGINLKPFIKKQFIALLREEKADEVQFTGKEDKFLDECFVCVNAKNADLTIHPQYGSAHDIHLLGNEIRITKFASDHL